MSTSIPAPARPVPATPGASRPPRLRGIARLRAFRSDIRDRLERARALERLPPERFGFSVGQATRLFMVTCALYRHYFRTQCFGLETQPTGAAMLVANHASHALAWDGANIVSAGLLDADPPRLIHGMGEHRLMDLPIIGAHARGIGAVDGRPPECISLLRAGAVVLTFPEGTRAHGRSYRDRYQLAPFGHGFARIALTTGVPIVPVAAIGAEEEAPLLANPRWLQRLMKVPCAPVTATLVVPLPVRYRLHFGRPIWLTGSLEPRNVAHGVEQVRRVLGEMIVEGLASRRRVFV
jgi:1-acyl-sn-glycerol-3-phosphate acyltransferase